MKLQAVKQVKVAFITTEWCAVPKSIFEGIKKELSSDMNVLSFKVFEAKGPYNEVIKKHTIRAIQEGFDLLIPIGIRSVPFVAKVTADLAPHIPVIATAFNSPIKNGLVRSMKSSGNNIVCVASDPPKHLLLAKVVLILRPQAKNIFIPYREDTLNGNAHEEMLRMKDFFERRGKEVTLFAISTPGIPCELNDAIKDTDLIVTPEGCLLASDVRTIKSYADALGIESFIDGVHTINEGTVFGMRYDFVRVGITVGEYIREILFNGKRPRSLQSVVTMGLRSIFHRKSESRASSCKTNRV